MYWIIAIGFCAVACLATVTIVLLYRRRKPPVELPDGDYVVRVEEVRETLRGVETVYIIEEPKGFEGRKFTIMQEKRDV